MMKKIMALFLALVMVSGCITAFADDSEGYKKALSVVKERIGSTDEYDSFEGHTSDYGDGVTYEFYWEGDSSSLSVSITEGGIINHYYCYDRGNDDSVLLSERLSEAEAWDKIREWLVKINPDISHDISLVDSASDTYRYNFEFVLNHNGYKIADHVGMVSVEADDLSVRSFYLDYREDAKFQQGEVIDIESAKEIYKSDIGFELKYVSDFDDNDDITARPVYAPKDHKNRFVSAITGEVFEITEDSSESIKGSNTLSAEYAAADTAEGGGFTPAELEEFEKIELTISQKAAIDAVKNCKYFKLPAEAFDKYLVSTYNIDDDTRGYRLTFKYDGINVSARVNADTGEILYFSKNLSGKDVRTTEEQAQKTASDALKYLAPDVADQYTLNEDREAFGIPYRTDEEAPKAVSFNYDRYVNGIPYYENGVSLTVDLADNSVSYYYISHDDIEFPSIENVVSYDAAAEEYFDKIGFEPMYIPDKDEYKLVYIPLSIGNEIDAFTGEADVTDVVESYDDVAGHYCEKYVNALLDLKIGFNTAELKPDEPIKQKEFAMLLSECVRSSGSVMLDDETDYDGLYEYSIYRIIEDESERNPDGNVTRLDAAKFMVTAMGYGEIGSLDVYRPMFNDMEHAGYASIMCGLKIMNGDGYGNFNPGGVLTRGQALIMIYNFWNK